MTPAKSHNPLTDRGLTNPKTLPLGSVDYYTATTFDQSIGFGWGDIFEDYRKAAMVDGAKVKPFRRFTYECLTIAHMTYGRSLDWGWLLTASSDEAERTWHKVWPDARRVTRVDLAYTYCIPGIDDYVETLYEPLRDKHRPSYRYIENSLTGGQTMYVGAPSSDQTGRVYYKSRQDPGQWPDNTYRAEVQIRKPRSDAMAREMIQLFSLGVFGENYVRNNVINWFQERRVSLDVPYESDVTRFQVAKQITTDDRKLRWLRTQVAPTLIDLTGRGKVEQLSMALGLTKQDYVQLSLYAPDKEKLKNLTNP